MGCSTSKKTDATTPYVYRPPPSSFTVFDINAVEVPWVKVDNNGTQLNNHQKSTSHVPPPLLEKLGTYEKDSDRPRSKTLEDRKKPSTKPSTSPSPVPSPQPPKNNFFFHTQNYNLRGGDIMGCSTSKKTNATTVYRPPPSSFTVFDINALEVPWVKLDNNGTQLDNHQKSSSHVPPPLLEKLGTFEKDSDRPRSWEEISKTLEDLKKPSTKPNTSPIPVPSPQPPKNNFFFHTLEEFEAQKDDAKKQLTQVKKTEATQNESFKFNEAKHQLRKTESTQAELPGRVGGPGRVSGTLKANPFIIKDRLEKAKEGKEALYDKIMKRKKDPLSIFPEACPPGGSHLVVLYTTSLGGVRRTFEDCNRVRAILEYHRVMFDERDVSLHGSFLAELKELMASMGRGGDGVGVPVPRLFVKGRCLGGVAEVVELTELGQLGRILSSARVERGLGWQGCEGCGGARFVPCLECGGSCKLVIGDEKERCPKCNENGLVHCPMCH